MRSGEVYVVQTDAGQPVCLLTGLTSRREAGVGSALEEADTVADCSAPIHAILSLHCDQVAACLT